MTIDIICERQELEQIADFFNARGVAVTLPPTPLEAGGSAKGTLRLQITIDAVVRLAKIIFEFLNNKPAMTIRFKSNTTEMRISKNATVAEIEAAIVVNNSKEFEFKIEG